MLHRRIDSWQYDIDQLLFGTMLFTLVTFLLPTVGTFYLLFAFVRSTFIPCCSKPKYANITDATDHYSSHCFCGHVDCTFKYLSLTCNNTVGERSLEAARWVWHLFFLEDWMLTLVNYQKVFISSISCQKEQNTATLSSWCPSTIFKLSSFFNDIIRINQHHLPQCSHSKVSTCIIFCCGHYNSRITLHKCTQQFPLSKLWISQHPVSIHQDLTLNELPCASKGLQNDCNARIRNQTRQFAPRLRLIQRPHPYTPPSNQSRPRAIMSQTAEFTTYDSDKSDDLKKRRKKKENRTWTFAIDLTCSKL